jgi:multidrug efflux pump subunit AcrA (membrane-fusion protein)
MTPQRQTPLGVERAMQALLELVESCRSRLCEEILGEAKARAQALRAQAQAGARSRMRQTFAEQRQRRRAQIAAVQARLATERRLHEQQRTAALLLLAREQLPRELAALWQQPQMRATWVGAVLGAAQAHLRPGPWRIVHAADWPEAERQLLVRTPGAVSQGTPRFEVDPKLVAGLKVISDGNVIDGTLDGLLADRADFEARLLRGLELAP